MYESILPFRPPFDWTSLLRFLQARAVEGIESVEAERYTCTVRLDRSIGSITVRQSDSGDALVARVALPAATRNEVVRRLTSMFDLDAEPEEIARILKRSPYLRPLARAHPGIRVPGAWEPFEIVARAIVGQQISVAGARTILRRIAERASGGRRLTFPDAREIASTDLRGLGMPDKRAKTLRAAALAVVRGDVNLEEPSLACQALRALPGIGPWTVGYIAMRALRDRDALPHGDLVLRQGLGDGTAVHPRRLLEASESWRPWRAYATILLWSAHNGGNDE